MLGAGDTLAWDGVNVGCSLHRKGKGAALPGAGDRISGQDHADLRRFGTQRGGRVAKACAAGGGAESGAPWQRQCYREDFLHRVSPKVALISVGASIPTGHPAPETLMRLYEAGAQVLHG